MRVFVRVAAVAAGLVVFASARAAEPKIDVLAARAGKGVLVLQTGSDWCVSGEQVRKVFESSEFRRAVGSKYIFAVHDEMEEPTDAAKESNAAVSDILVRTKRFPAITCYAPGTSLRVFAQLENVPGNVTAEKLAELVAKVSARKNQAEALFKKALRCRVRPDSSNDGDFSQGRGDEGQVCLVRRVEGALRS